MRAPSPILYTVTSILVFLAARALYGDRIGFWSAVVFATLPAATFSSLLISTDVAACPVLDLGLLRLDQADRDPEMRFALLIGVSLGLGLLAKYAAVYFLLCAWRSTPGATRAPRDALRGGRGVVVLAIALAFLAPNLLWNATPRLRHLIAHG